VIYFTNMAWPFFRNNHASFLLSELEREVGGPAVLQSTNRNFKGHMIQ